MPNMCSAGEVQTSLALRRNFYFLGATSGGILGATPGDAGD